MYELREIPGHRLLTWTGYLCALRKRHFLFCTLGQLQADSHDERHRSMHSPWVSKWCAISSALLGSSEPRATVMILDDTPSSKSSTYDSSIAPTHCWLPMNAGSLSPAQTST